MRETLTLIQRDMAFMGWKGDAAKGFDHKVDVNGNVIARHHDETWLADFEEASARVERQLAREELERRLAHQPRKETQS